MTTKKKKIEKEKGREERKEDNGKKWNTERGKGRKK